MTTLKTNIYHCADCGKETDALTQPSTYCSKCQKDFCFAMSSCCFSNHLRRTGCNGRHMSISNPQWKINLRISE